MMLDAVIDEVNRRGCQRLDLWRREHQNEHAQRLYRSRSFAPTGRPMKDCEGEWWYDCH